MIFAQFTDYIVIFGDKKQDRAGGGSMEDVKIFTEIIPYENQK